MMHRNVDQTRAPDFSEDAREVECARLSGEARAVPPAMVLWSEELEARRLAVSRWRGVGYCAGDFAQ